MEAAVSVANVRKNKKPHQPCAIPETDPRFEERRKAAEQDETALTVDRQVDAMDHSPLDVLLKGVGSPSYDPVLMLKMVLYMILQGHCSPARWHAEAKRNLSVQWLGKGITPCRRTWYNFRNRFGAVVETLHAKLVETAINEGHVTAETVAQDGTSIAACASRHKMVNQKVLSERIALLSSIVAGGQSFAAPLPSWVPSTEIGRLQLSKRMTEASEILAGRISQNAAKKAGKRKNPAKIQVSLTDPIAPLGRDKLKVFRPLYTLQFMTDATTGMIISFSCRPEATDAGTLIPMIDQVRRTVGERLKNVLADASYCSIFDLKACQERSIELLAPVQSNSFTEKKTAHRTNGKVTRDQFRFDADGNYYVCPQNHCLRYLGREQKNRHSDQMIMEYRYGCDVVHCSNCPIAAQCLGPQAKRRMIKRLDGQEFLDAQRKKMADPDVKKKFAKRGQSVELGFADAKHHRGFQRFHGRGPAVAHAESGLVVLAHTILCLQRLQQKSKNAAITAI
jgi:transposase